MARRSVAWHVPRLAGIAPAAGVLVAGSVLLPAAPLQASSPAASDSGAPLGATPQGGAPLSLGEDRGVIAYVDRATTNIHVVSPDGVDRVL